MAELDHPRQDALSHGRKTNVHLNDRSRLPLTTFQENRLSYQLPGPINDNRVSRRSHIDVEATHHMLPLSATLFAVVVRVNFVRDSPR
eukprot:7467259-Heterocapsa_arctica.AAC.1